MCGIFGVLSNSPCSATLIQGLLALEYRGYDSAGFATVSHSSKKVNIQKVKGRVSNLAVSAHQDSVGIAHTRWATHGEPSERNAHPHTDSKNEFAVVHNGIIENFEDLKQSLLQKGVVFTSQTDSEVIAHLISQHYKGSLLDAVSLTLPLLHGAYALLVISSHEPDIVVAAKKSSPLIIGVAENTRYLASDVSALMQHTRQVIYLEDDDICLLTKCSHRIISKDNPSHQGTVTTLDWTIDAHSKAGFPHYMLKEIFEQPQAITNAFSGRLKRIIDLGSLSNINLPPIDKIIITACGTSYYAGLLAKHYFESLAHIPVEVDYASELRYRQPLITKKTLLIAISQSGETADTLEALRLCKEQGAHTIGVVNVVGSSIARLVHSGLYLHAGPEIGVASTKAFTTQLACLLLLAVDLASKKSLLDDEFLAELLKATADLPEVIEQSLPLIHQHIKPIVKVFDTASNALFMGRGMFFPVALEGALKLKEISYIHAEGLPAAEMKHGPIALIDKHMPVIILAPHDKVFAKILSNIHEVKARQGICIIFSDTHNSELEHLADHFIKLPVVHELLKPILFSIPLQLLAYEAAVRKGHCPDKPRNLAKSVTVE